MQFNSVGDTGRTLQRSFADVANDGVSQLLMLAGEMTIGAMEIKVFWRGGSGAGTG
jgi:hypothetical protein